MELLRENIEFEQLLTETYADTVVREEYVVPDTLPDVHEILMLDASPRVTNHEIQEDKIYLEGKVNYTILYLSKVNDVTEVQSLNYSSTFSNTMECREDFNDIECYIECFVEHMECNMVNERKIGIAGIIKSKGDVYNKYSYQVVKDIDNAVDTQFAKTPIKIDKVVENVVTELMGESQMLVAMEKPQIDKVLKVDVILNKKELKLFEGKLRIEASGKVTVLYQPLGENNVYVLEDVMSLEKEMDFDDLDPTMESYLDMKVYDVNYALREDDLGEKRIVDIALSAKVSSKVMKKEELDMIEDAYSPSMILNMERKQIPLNVMHKQVSEEKIHKFDIELDNEAERPKEVILAKGDVSISDCKVLEDKVTIEGTLKVDVVYRTVDEDIYIASVSDESPISFTVDMPGAKIDMQSICKCTLENLEVDVQASNLAVKAVISVYARCDYKDTKEFVTNIVKVEGEVPKKKASIIIYVIQKGDTLWKIAKHYNTTVDSLCKLNEVMDPEKLVTGQKLIIPGRAVI